MLCVVTHLELEARRLVLCFLCDNSSRPVLGLLLIVPDRRQRNELYHIVLTHLQWERSSDNAQELHELDNFNLWKVVGYREVATTRNVLIRRQSGLESTTIELHTLQTTTRMSPLENYLLTLLELQLSVALRGELHYSLVPTRD